MLTLKVKRLTETAKLPTKAHSTDAAFDVYVDEERTLMAGERYKFRLGVAFDIPPGNFLMMLPRSGLSVSMGSGVLANVIDEGYTGEVHAVIVNHGDKMWHIEQGAKVAQVVLLPVLEARIEEVSEIANKDRGDAGFGSTGVF